LQISNVHVAIEINQEIKAQVQSIVLEKACNRRMTFKDTQGHYNYCYYLSRIWIPLPFSGLLL